MVAAQALGRPEPAFGAPRPGRTSAGPAEALGVTDRELQLVQWLETGIGVFAPDLANAMDALPADLLADRLALNGGHAGCDIAYILARRHDPRGIAALARSATILAQAGRALRYLELLDMLDMVPPAYRTPEARDRAAAVDLLGTEPAELTALWRGRGRWPDRPEPVDITLFRFRLASQPAGLVLVNPVQARVDGGVANLDAEAALALICGQSFAFGVPRVPLAEVPPEQVAGLVGRPPHHELTRPALAGAWRVHDVVVLLLSGRRRGRRGYLVGDVLGAMPPGWYEADPEVEDEPLSGDQAFWLWFGRALLHEAA